jgi:hypothetical protein
MVWSANIFSDDRKKEGEKLRKWEGGRVRRSDNLKAECGASL